jgi:hypothetical protein
MLISTQSVNHKTIRFVAIIICAWFFSLNAKAQVTLGQADMPQVNDVLVTRGASLVSQPNLNQTGPNQTWNYGFDVLTPNDSTNSVACVDVNASPITYQIFFNNPFDPQHNSDFAQGISEFSAGTFTFQDVYAYFQNTSSRYAQTGVGATINGVPIPSQGNPVDVIYHYPIQFGQIDSSHSELDFSIPTIGGYHQSQDRHNEVLGWGTLNLYGFQFPSLLMVTTLSGTDSIYIDALGTGTAIPRPVTIQYKWLSPGIKVPVLQINTLLGQITNVVTADVIDQVQEINSSAFTIYPNPVKDVLFWNSDSEISGTYTIFNLQGQMLQTGAMQRAHQIGINNCPSGTYYLLIKSTKGECFGKLFIKE